MFSAKEKPPAPLTDGHDNTKDQQTMMEESWHPCTYIPYISFGHHKQTNLPSANSPPDMLMLTLNGCICVHGVYLPFPEFLKPAFSALATQRDRRFRHACIRAKEVPVSFAPV